MSSLAPSGCSAGSARPRTGMGDPLRVVREPALEVVLPVEALEPGRGAVRNRIIRGGVAPVFFRLSLHLWAGLLGDAVHREHYLTINLHGGSRGPVGDVEAARFESSSGLPIPGPLQATRTSSASSWVRHNAGPNRMRSGRAGPPCVLRAAPPRPSPARRLGPRGSPAPPAAPAALAAGAGGEGRSMCPRALGSSSTGAPWASASCRAIVRPSPAPPLPPPRRVRDRSARTPLRARRPPTRPPSRTRRVAAPTSSEVDSRTGVRPGRT